MKIISKRLNLIIRRDEILNLVQQGPLVDHFNSRKHQEKAIQKLN